VNYLANALSPSSSKQSHRLAKQKSSLEIFLEQSKGELSNLKVKKIELDVHHQSVEMPFDPRVKLGQGFELEGSLAKASPFVQSKIDAEDFSSGASQAVSGGKSKASDSKKSDKPAKTDDANSKTDSDPKTDPVVKSDDSTSTDDKPVKTDDKPVKTDDKPAKTDDKPAKTDDSSSPSKKVKDDIRIDGTYKYSKAGFKTTHGSDGEISVEIAHSLDELATILNHKTEIYGEGWGASAKAGFSVSKSTTISKDQVVLVSHHRIDLGESILNPS